MRKTNGSNISSGKATVTAKSISVLKKKIDSENVKLTVPPDKILKSLKKLKPTGKPAGDPSSPLQQGARAMNTSAKRFHGTPSSKKWFPPAFFKKGCCNPFGYMSTPSARNKSKLPFNSSTRNLLDQLGSLIADTGRETSSDSPIPAGFTYFGQFVDHDITLDISTSLDSSTNASKHCNMRTPALDLDNVYGQGPALAPFLYDFPSTSEPPTKIKMKLGKNKNTGVGGPAGSSSMVRQTEWDVPRVPGSLTAIIGDPRNDENLIVSQIQHAFLRFHNSIIDMLALGSFTGDYFAEAKAIATHHYQWAVVNDFLTRVCGKPAVDDALASVSAPVGSSFSMPVEFSVAAYRFGHSMIRDNYWISFAIPNSTLGQVFDFIRKPRLPVHSNWVVDFNAFFDTGISVPINNKARRIDSVLAHDLENLPGFSGLMAILASRNLRRGLALGLPSGQAMATSFGMSPMTQSQISSGLPTNEKAVLNQSRKLLLRKTPLWYYVLREAAVLKQGKQLGPVGAKIVADTFVRILKRDGGSYLNVTGGFTPSLPSQNTNKFTVADMLTFAGVTQP